VFKIFDLNMNEIPFPDGLMPLEIFVGSIAKERISEPIPGRPGVVDYGFTYRDRPVELFMRIKSEYDWHYRTLRNEIYELFDVGEAFYLAEADVPSRVLKVVVDESYIPDRLTENYADIDVICRTLDSVFWESIYTTKELNDTDYDAAVAKYGLVDDIDVDQTQYQFTPARSTADVSGYTYTHGFISSSTGIESSHEKNIITSSYITVYPAMTYEFEDTGDNPDISYWWIYEYDDSNNFIKAYATNAEAPSKHHIFKPSGSRIRLMANAKSGVTLNISDVGVNILPKLRRNTLKNTFSVYNAGNVTVEPEFMPLQIEIRGLVNPSDFSIKNLTTGDEFVYNGRIEGYTLRIKDMQVTYSSVYNHLRQTNRQFISLASGLNEFEISGGAYEFIYFDFKYYYR